MVSTSHPLASQAGLEILKKGGNAVDAAIATAAALTVVQPTANGLGSDVFAIVWKDGKLHGLNGSGPSPASHSIEKFKAMGMEAIPNYGWPAVNVPAAPAAWAELSAKLGRLPLEQVLEPAITYARGGHAISVGVSYWMHADYGEYDALRGEEFAPWREVFCPNGRLPRPGELFKSPGHAWTLERIAATNARSFYEGEIAEKILSASKKTGGFFSEEDLASFKPEWVEPISVNYRGYDVWEIPPNGQGIIVLLALNILREYGFPCHGDPLGTHRQIEAIKLGFADARRYVADMAHAQVPVKELLSETYASARRGLIAPHAQDFKAGDPYSGGTVYLAAADGEGCMVSFIQSNYMGFGSFVVVPETGIALNNRGTGFSLDPSHPNALAPRKRPYHTIIPGFLTKDGAPVGPFGVMGGYMQPQGHVQVVMNMLDFAMNPQEAIDAPRWQWMGGMKVEVEPGFANNAAQSLARMGHEIAPSLTPFSFGRGEIIQKTPEGTLVGATEPRSDGCVAAW